MLPVRLKPPVHLATCSDNEAYASRLLLGRGSVYGLFRDFPAARARRRHGCNVCPTIAQSLNNSTTLASASRSPRQSTTTTAPNQQQSSFSSSSSSTSGGSGGSDPDNEQGSSSGNSLQIGLDPFSQQLITSALTAGAAYAIATFTNLDMLHALRMEGDAVALALQLSAPVLVLLLAVVTPRWAPPFKGSELERLRHNYYMTAQVLQLYLDFGDEDEEGSNDSSGSGTDSSSSDERARVRRRLRLEQTVGWGTISSGLALMQAFTLQPWNPPTANSVFGLALAGRSTQQLANEFLVRGAGWGLLSGWVAGELQSADASDGILFFGKVFGGPDAVKYAAGLALVALALPGALWEARAARNFVRASVVGPVRDAAIFCTGNGVDEPAYCDPKGFAMLAARRPANAAPVADVVTRTRGWRSGPEASYSSVSSLGSVDMAELDELDEGRGEAAKKGQGHPQGNSTAAVTTSITVAIPPSTPSTPSTPSSPAPSSSSHLSVSSAASSTSSSSSSSSAPQSLLSSSPAPSPASSASSSASSISSDSASEPSSYETITSNSPGGLSPPLSHSGPLTSSSSSPSSPITISSPSSSIPTSSSSPTSSSIPTSSSSSSSSSIPTSSSSFSPASSSLAPVVPEPPASPTPTPSSSGPLPLGPTLAPSSTAFEWDSEDMGVLLKVETFQDKIAFSSSLYYQLLAAFAINGAFLASDCNLLASFFAAWLLRTGPLLLSELRARAAADAAIRV